MIARACILAVLVALPALAMAKDRVADVVLEPLAACHAIADPQLRLGCYDKAFERLEQSVGDRRIVAVDRAVSTATVGRAAAPAAGAGPRDDDRFITSTVASAISYGNDEWGVRLADGSRWRTTQPGLGKLPQTGADVRIRPGAIGGSILQIGRGPKVHVMPDRKGKT